MVTTEALMVCTAMLGVYVSIKLCAGATTTRTALWSLAALVFNLGSLGLNFVLWLHSGVSS